MKICFNQPAGAWWAPQEEADCDHSISELVGYPRITGNYCEFRTNSAPTSPTNRFWHPRQPQRIPLCLGRTVHCDATSQGPLTGIFSDRIPVPRGVCVRDKTTLQNTSKFKRRCRDDIHRPKHTFVITDFEYKKFPMWRIHKILV